jgi:hypothetical protein
MGKTFNSIRRFLDSIFTDNRWVCLNGVWFRVRAKKPFTIAFSLIEDGKTHHYCQTMDDAGIITNYIDGKKV